MADNHRVADSRRVAGNLLADVAGNHPADVVDNPDVADNRLADVADNHLAGVAGNHLVDVADNRLAGVVDSLLAGVAGNHPADVADNRLADVADSRCAAGKCHVVDNLLAGVADNHPAEYEDDTGAENHHPAIQPRSHRDGIRLHQIPHFVLPRDVLCEYEALEYDLVYDNLLNIHQLDGSPHGSRSVQMTFLRFCLLNLLT